MEKLTLKKIIRILIASSIGIFIGDILAKLIERLLKTIKIKYINKFKRD